MNTSSLKSLVLVTALALSLGATARAGSAVLDEKPAPMVGNLSLLGQTYGTLTYSYINVDDVSSHGDRYNFEVNQPLAFGIDGFLSFEHSQSSEVAGSRVKQNILGGALRAFSTSYNWGKPYVEAGAGYTWARYAGAKDNSFIWHLGVGAEFQVTPQATVTPYVTYEDAPSLAGGNTWNFGVKANYWIDSSWAVTAGLSRNDEKATAFTIGTNFRF
jgi:hypothetical protein